MSIPTYSELMVDDEERELLLNLLEGSLGDTRVEFHRTHTPTYRREVLRREEVIRRLIERLRTMAE